VTADGRLFVTDCGTSTGTWRRSPKDDTHQWEPIRQAFIGDGDLLRLGDYECVTSELLAPVLPRYVADAPSRPESVHLGHGRVERDSLTGEIVRRRP
jgi:hypothetical protein